MNKIRPVILAGGRGKRLWPVSSTSKPKQFLPLISGKTLFEETIDRCSNRDLFLEPMVVTNQIYEDAVISYTPNNSTIILEKTSQNTAFAIALATLAAQADDILIIMPSDHYIPDIHDFECTIREAVMEAKSDKLVTIGIPPVSPHTGYGYIQTCDDLNVKHFHEKPLKETAKKYLKNGRYYWNSGIYIASVKTLLREFEYYAPEILEFARYPEKLKCLNSISFDYAVAEKTENAKMVKAQFTWGDIGSWNALLKLKMRQYNG